MRAYHACCALKRQGETFEQAKAALLSHDDAGIRTWMREEGLPRGERRMRMTWDACAGPSLTST